MSRILVVEDDNDIAFLEKDYLEMNNYEVMVVSNGLEAISTLEKTKFDLVVLDLMLPGMGGLDVCKRIREINDIPVIMVTAKGEVYDKVRGLGLGANDYITKPFDPTELVARVKAQLANYNRLKGNVNEIIIDHIKIIPSNYQVFKDDIEIKLPSKEFELLNYMANNPNIVFTKEQLFERVWGLDSLGDDATVTVHINRIRDKIEKDPSNPRIIETVWGVGYRVKK